MYFASGVFDKHCTRISMFGEFFVHPRGVPSRTLPSPLCVCHTPYSYLGWDSFAVDQFWCTPSPHFTLNVCAVSLLAASYCQPLVWHVDGTNVLHCCFRLLPITSRLQLSLGRRSPGVLLFVCGRSLWLFCAADRWCFSPFSRFGKGGSKMRANMAVHMYAHVC